MSIQWWTDLTADVGGDDLLVALSTIAVGWGAAWFGSQVSTKNFRLDLEYRETQQRLRDLAEIQKGIQELTSKRHDPPELSMRFTFLVSDYFKTVNFTITEQDARRYIELREGMSFEGKDSDAVSAEASRMVALLAKTVVQDQISEALRLKRLLRKPNIFKRIWRRLRPSTAKLTLGEWESSNLPHDRNP